jgi:uncharacterized protein
MEWAITGNSPVSKTYASRKQFSEEVIAPLNERLSVKIVPGVRGIYAKGGLWTSSTAQRLFLL